MSFEILLDQARLAQMQERAQKREFYRGNTDPEFARNVAKSASLYPNLTPATLIALNRAGASPQAFAKAGELRMREDIDRDPEEAEKRVDWWGRTWFGKALMGATRQALITGDVGPETASSWITPGGWKDPAGMQWSSKQGVQLSGVDPGTGFFPSAEFYAEQERRAIEFRTTPETTTYQYAWVTGEDGIPRRQIVPAGITPGRAVRDALNIRVDSTLGNAVSGFIDALNVMAFDTTLIGRPLKGLRAISRGLRHIEMLRASKVALPGAIETTSGLRRVAELKKLGESLKRAPSTAAEKATIAQIRAASKPEEIAELLTVRAGNVIAPDAPRWLRDGEGTWTQVGPTRWEYLDDVDLQVLRGDIDADAAEAYRRSRTYEIRDLKDVSEATVWNTSRAKVVLDMDPRAQYIVRTIAGMDTSSPALAHRIRRDIYRGKISMEDADLLADAVRSGNGSVEAAEGAVKQTLLEMFDRLARPDSPAVSDLDLYGGFLRQSARQIKGIWSKNPSERIFDAGHIRRMFGIAPGRALFVLSGGRARADAIDNLERYIDLTLPNATREERLGYIERAWKLLVQNEKNVSGILNDAGEIVPAGGTRSAMVRMNALIDEITLRMADEIKMPEKELEKLRVERESIRVGFRSYHEANVADGSRVNMFQELRQIGLISDDMVIEAWARRGMNIDRSLIDQLDSVGPELVSDLFDNVVLLPDIDAIRGLTRNPFFAKTIGRIGRKAGTGEANFVARTLDTAMNDVWRKSILSQVGYFTRNLLEGQFRAYITGHVSLVRNPIIYASYVINSPKFNGWLKPRGAWDLNGDPISMARLDEARQVLFDDLSTADQWLAEAASRQRWDLSMGPTPESSAQQMMGTGGWLPVDRSNNVYKPQGPEGAPSRTVVRPNAHTQGMIDQLRKMHMDKMQRIYLMFAGTGDAAARKQAVLDWLYTTKEGQQARRELMASYASGVRTSIPGIPERTVLVRPSRAMATTEEAKFLSAKIDIAAERAAQMDQIPELVLMGSINRIPVIDPATGRGIIREFEINMSTVAGRRLANRLFGDDYMDVEITPNSVIGRMFNFASEDAPRGNPDLGYFILNANESDGVVRVAAMEFVTDKRVGDQTVKSVVWGTTNTHNYADDAILAIESIKDRAALNATRGDTTLNDLIPQRVGWADRDPFDENRESAFRRLLRTYSEIVFSGDFEGTSKFGQIVQRGSRKFAFGRGMTKLEKIPFIRQNYYKHALDNLQSLSREEALRLKKHVEQLKSRYPDMTYEDIMGQMPRNILTQNAEESMWDRLNFLLERTRPGEWGSYKMEDLHDYAMARSVYEMKELFFDASTRTNFDANLGMRVNLAFVAAWASITKDFGVMLAKNPAKGYRFARATEAAVGSEASSDRREGFFRVNPVTGEYEFTLPMYDALIRRYAAFRGIDANVEFTGPLRGINVGLSGLPALNPVGNVAASKVLEGLAAFGGDWGRNLEKILGQTFLPYGSKTSPSEFLQSFVPTSVRKIVTSFFRDKENFAQVYARNLQEVSPVLAGSGNYDIRNPDPQIRDSELSRLEKDAAAMAFATSMVEGISGFLGPAAGNARFMVDTKLGEFSLPYLAKVLQDLREDDYETAIPRFIDAYGTSVIYLVAGKNKTLIPGMSPTEPFYDFQRKHEAMFERYRDVAGYLAPEGDVFEFSAWAYQQEKGYTERLVGAQMVRANEYAVGAALYRVAREQFPTFLNKDQELWLKAYREKLNAQYPGYPVKPDFNVASFDNFLVRIEAAIQVPEWKDMDISRSIRAYLSIRADVLGQLRSKYGENATFASKRATPYRAQMREFANKLIEGNPEFARIYDRQLSREVALVGEAP